MKQRMNHYLFCLAMLFSIMNTQAQHFGQPGVQTPVYRNTNAGIPYGYYEYLPQNYDVNPNTTQKYPVVIFFGGVGELGNGTTQLSKLLNPDAPPRIIKEGRHFPAIVISAQHSGWFDEPQSKQLYDYIVSRYPVDLNRVYVTGLSAGGSATWKFARANPELIAAIVPICGATQYKSAVPQLKNMPVWAFHNVLDGCGGGGVPSVWTMDNCDQITGISASVKNVYPGGWGYCVTAGFDVTMHNLNNLTWTAQTGVAAPQQKMAITMYNKSGHGGWSTVYRSQYMWNWLFAQTRGGSTANDGVIVDAGNDVQEILPKSQIKLNGSAYSLLGTPISGYSWTKISGPTVTMSGASTSTLTLTNLSPGTYQFKLTASNTNGKSGQDNVNVTIKASPTANAGSDQNISLPQDSTLLYGNASHDVDGYITSYQWTLLSSNVTGTTSAAPTYSSTTTAYKVSVNFTPSSVKAPAPWNNMDGNCVAGTKLQNMNDGNGNATTMDIELMTNWNGSKSGGKTTGNNSGVYPDKVIEGLYWFQNSSPQIKISGLDPNRQYNFSFFGSRTGWGLDKTTVYSIGNKSDQLNAADNTHDVAHINNIQPNSNGVVMITVSTGAGATYGYLNALEVECLGQATAPPPPPAPTASNSIYINFTPGYLQAGAPWNNMNGTTSAGYGLNNMKADDNTTTTVDIQLVNYWDGSKTGGKTTGNNSGVYPDNILDGFYWFLGGTREIEVSDLDPNAKYDFTFMGSRIGWGTNKTTVYKIGNKQGSLNAAENTSNVVVLEDITPNANGRVIIEVSKGAGSSYGYLNAMVITPKTSAPGVQLKDANQQVAKVTGLIEGNYSFELMVTDNHGLIDKDTVIVVVGSGGSLRLKPTEEPKQEETMEMTYKFYPNPAYRFLNIEMSDDQSYNIRIFNAAGQEFAPEVQKMGRKAILDVSALQTGYYVIQVVGDKGSKAERVFVAPR